MAHTLDGANGQVIAFAQNQRDEVRNLNGLAGALAAEPGMKQQTYIAFDDQRGRSNGGFGFDQARTLHAAKGMSEVQLIANTLQASEGGVSSGMHPVVPVAFDWTQNGRPSELSPTLRIGTGLDIPSGPAVLTGRAAGVRRLTPRECERLMGWPDDHTRYRADGSEIADGPRYRLCGNGVVANVAHWIGQRLMESQ